MSMTSRGIHEPGSLKRSVIAILISLWAITWSNSVPAVESARHPLDPLTVEELSSVVTALRNQRHADDFTLYPTITLAEPTKPNMLRWKPGDEVRRRAFAVVKNGPRAFEAVVDLSRNKVVSWKEIGGRQPAILLTEEWTSAQKSLWANQDWRVALARRGVELQSAICFPNTVGYYGIAAEQGRRLVKVLCYDSRGVSNYWGRPIEGLIVLVDLDSHKVVKLIDTGPVPIPQGPVDIDEESVRTHRRPPNTISLAQPAGPSFTVNGQVVTWQNWQFHFRLDPRLGIVVSMVRYRDLGRMRSILYQASLSELFVPYMDPAVGWYFRTYLDVGEYGIGKLAASLQPDLDCPRNAMFFDAVFADDWGEAHAVPSALCLFERSAGDIAWRHSEAIYQKNEVRRRTDLVLRSVSTIGSYDYIFDWSFRQDGSMNVRVGSTGIPQVKAVRSRNVLADENGHDTAHGHMVAEHTVAPNHDHFFNFRIDLDIDGLENSLVIGELTVQRLKPKSLRKSLWRVVARTAETEDQAKLRISLERPALWRVINPGVKGPLGNPVSYQIKHEGNAVSLLSQDDFPQRRAGFTNYHLWVTPYRPEERYAAGPYPNQSEGNEGLPRWTRANRSIANRDIVLWYTLGFHHVVRAEDWPVMPTTWSGFELRPFDFFQSNPALDLPRLP